MIQVWQRRIQAYENRPNFLQTKESLIWTRSDFVILRKSTYYKNWCVMARESWFSYCWKGHRISYKVRSLEESSILDIISPLPSMPLIILWRSWFNMNSYVWSHVLYAKKHALYTSIFFLHVGFYRCNRFILYDETDSSQNCFSDDQCQEVRLHCLFPTSNRGRILQHMLRFYIYGQIMKEQHK